MFGRMGTRDFARAGNASTHHFSLLTDPDLLAYYDALDTANITTPSGAVATWVPSFGSAGNVAQGTAGSRPTHSSGKVTFDAVDDVLESSQDPLSLVSLVRAVNLPAASNGAAAGGFTCTGLARAIDGTWWCGNDGRDVFSGSNGLQLPSVVHLSNDFSTKLGEILLKPLFSGTLSVQGVAIDPSDQTLWIASLDDKKILHISTAGSVIGSISLSYTPNGLCWDTLRDQMIIGRTVSDVNIEWRNRAGSVTKSASFGVSGITDPDHFFFNPYDGAEGQIWISQGANNSICLVEFYDIASSIVLGPTVGNPLTASGTVANAVEGLHYDFATETLTVLNDGAFHQVSDTPLNRALQYRFSRPLGTKFSVFCVAKWVAVQAISANIWSLGNPVATANYGGVALFNTANVTNQVRVFSQTGTSVASQDIISVSIADNRVKSLYYIEFDYVAKTVNTYIAGVLASSGALTNSLGVGFTGRKQIAGARRADSTGVLVNFANIELSALGWRRGIDAGVRRAVTTYLTARHGL